MWVFVGIMNWPSCFPHCPVMIHSDTLNVWTDYGTFSGSPFHLAKYRILVKASSCCMICFQHFSDFTPYCSPLNPFPHHMVLLYFTHIILFLLEGLFLLLLMPGIHIPVSLTASLSSFRSNVTPNENTYLCIILKIPYFYFLCLIFSCL